MATLSPGRKISKNTTPTKITDYRDMLTQHKLNFFRGLEAFKAT